MNLVRLLLRSSRGIVILSATAGVTGGVAGIALIALIQGELARERSTPSTTVWAFAGLCLVSAAARVIGQVGMVKLGQRTVAELGLHIVRRTLELPLREFESIDTSALLAALTEDIVLIANAMVGVPHLCINIPIVIACLAYIGWLSPAIFACGVSFAALAIAAYVFLSSRGVAELRRARDRQDALVGHFRTLIGGFRELKLHRGRRASFLAESVEPTMACVRRDMVRGLSGFAVAEGWSQLAFFGFIGVLLFAVPRLEPIGLPTLVSAVLVVLYLMTPLDTILTWLPIVGRARASLLKVQSLIPALERHGDAAEGRPAPARPLALPRLGQPRSRDVRLSRRASRGGLRAGPRRPDPSEGRDRHPGRGKRLRQDDPGQADLGAVLAGGGHHPARRAGARARGPRGLSTARLGRLRRRPSLPRPQWARPGWHRGEGPRGAGRPGAGQRGHGPSGARFRPPTSPRGSGAGSPCSAPVSRIGRSSYSTSGPPIRTPRSSSSSIPSCSQS